MDPIFVHQAPFICLLLANVLRVKQMLLRHVYLNSLQGKSLQCIISALQRVGEKDAKHVRECVHVCVLVPHSRNPWQQRGSLWGKTL